MQLADKRIIVTGGARGIGAAIVAAYIAEGAHVISLDVDTSQDPVMSEGGGWAKSRICDISDSASVNEAFDFAIGQLGGGGRAGQCCRNSAQRHC